MQNLREILLPKANAQTVNTFAQPTFGPINGGSGGTSAGSVFLSVDKTDVDIGETFTLKVNVSSNDIPINAMQIVVDFNPSLLTVLDADSSTTGTQVEVVDSVFSVVSPETNNLVSNTGQIRVLLTSASAVSVDGDVLSITMQSQASGSAVIEVNETTDASILQQSDGSALAFTTNQNTVDISTTIFGEETPDPTQPDSTPVSNPVSVAQPDLPNTALPQEIEEFFPLLAGLALITIGLSLIKGQKHKDDKTVWS